MLDKTVSPSSAWALASQSEPSSPLCNRPCTDVTVGSIPGPEDILSRKLECCCPWWRVSASPLGYSGSHGELFPLARLHEQWADVSDPQDVDTKNALDRTDCGWRSIWLGNVNTYGETAFVIEIYGRKLIYATYRLQSAHTSWTHIRCSVLARLPPWWSPVLSQRRLFPFSLQVS